METLTGDLVPAAARIIEISVYKELNRTKENTPYKTMGTTLLTNCKDTSLMSPFIKAVMSFHFIDS